MKIDNISIEVDGFVKCISCFYTVEDVISTVKEFFFKVGENKLLGSIDSGIFAISYLVGTEKSKKSVLGNSIVKINNEASTFDELHKYSCYIDTSYPLFSSGKSVKSLIIKGLKKSKSKNKYEEIKNLFCLDDERIDRPLKACGNEKIRAMAAIGYAFGKQVFCFPWLSKRRYSYFYNHIKYAVDTLTSLGAIVIVPREDEEK